MKRFAKALLYTLGTLVGVVAALVEILLELISPPKPRRRR